MARPKKIDKKIPILIKLPPDLVIWLRKQEISQAALIEKALRSYFKL